MAFDMRKIGTAVVLDDGFTQQLGMVADHVTDRWGTRHVVAVAGEFREYGPIGGTGKLGIGVKVATEAEVKRLGKERAL